MQVGKNWSPVRILEQTELARGGLNGNMNEQAKALAERTELLKDEKADKVFVDQKFVDSKEYDKTFDTEAELLSFIPLPVDFVAKAYDTFKVFRWNGAKWNAIGKSELDLAKEDTLNKLSAIDSYRVNAGKNYPFLRKVRAGIDFGPRQSFLDCVLDIKIHGASPLYFYRIAIIENGNTSLGGTGQGIRIEKALISTFSTTGAATIIHSNTSAVTLNLDYATKGLQRRIIKTDTDNVYIEIVIDVDKMPEFGTTIVAANNVSLGYNWIIDPMCYTSLSIQQVNDSVNALNLVNATVSNINYSHLKTNIDKDYPVVRATRSLSAPIATHPYLRKSLIGAEVIGARKDYFYRIAYIQNGSDGTALGVSTKYGISVTRIPKDRLADAYEQNIVSYADTDIQLIPDRVKGGIQTFFIECPRDPGTIIKLIFDVDKMPEDGTAFSITSTSTYGYNAIIDPSCYTYRNNEFSFLESELFVEYDPAFEVSYLAPYTTIQSRLMVTYLSGNKWYRIHLARKGVNNTFQPLGFSYADAYTILGDLIPVDKAKLEIRTEAGSDWHAPVVFTADNNPDLVVKGATGTMGDIVKVFTNDNVLLGSVACGTTGIWYYNVTGQYNLGDTLKYSVNDGELQTTQVTNIDVIYTAGAHGTDSNTGIDHTAIQRDLQIFIDDVKIDLTKSFKTKAKKVHCLVTNDVRAGNTYASGRYCLEQNYRYDLSVNGLWIQTCYLAREDLTFTADNGCQHYLAGATPETSNTILFWGGSMKQRQNLQSIVFNSGAKADFPNVFGVTTRHPVAGEFTSWVDPGYGIGNREFLSADRPCYEHPRKNGKTYPRLITEMKIAKGKTYKWRGGYYWGMPRNTSFLDVTQKTQAGDVLVKNDGTYVVI